MTVTASGYARKENDLYQTEPWVTQVLLQHLKVDGLYVWDPCAGNHLMSDVIKKEGKPKLVVTSDLKTYDRKHDAVCDFFSPKAEELIGSLKPHALIANPPYGPGNRIAAHWARRSLALCKGQVALLLPAKFDFARTRRDLFADNERFAVKVVLLDRISWTLDGNTGTEDHCWMIWRGRRMTKYPTIVYAEKPR